MLSSCRHLVTGISAIRYNLLTQKFARGITSITSQKVHLPPSSTSIKMNEMKDEYGEMDCSGETFIAKNFVLESGEVLPEAHVCRGFVAVAISAEIIHTHLSNCSKDIHQNRRFRLLQVNLTTTSKGRVVRYHSKSTEI